MWARNLELSVTVIRLFNITIEFREAETAAYVNITNLHIVSPVVFFFPLVMLQSLMITVMLVVQTFKSYTKRGLVDSGPFLSNLSPLCLIEFRVLGNC